MLMKKPPMGYNTWNTFGADINEDLIKETADAMVSEGLLNAGYEYLVIDDCWAEYDRDPVTKRMVPDHNKFPHGMKSLSDYVHSKGLKFGMYSCAGVRTCADYPGSHDHEFLDADTFAEWGVDFLKYDFCYHFDHLVGANLYSRMGTALRACGRDILFSACNWGCDDVGSWGRSIGADMFRTTGDIQDNFDSFLKIAQSQAPNFSCNGPGAFNDMDMLTVGMYGKGNVGSSGCNDTEYFTQFATWCVFGAPLMLGCDVRHMTPETKKLILNKDLIAINQDEECRGPLRICYMPGENNVFMRHLSGNRVALIFINPWGEQKIKAYGDYMGLTANSGYHLEANDIMTGESIGQTGGYFYTNVPEHGAKVFVGQFVKD